MKILVTGGCGFIGSHLVRLLVEARGCEVVNLDKLGYAANPESLQDLSGHPGYRFEAVDICDADALSASFLRHQPDAVMHLAAETHVDRSIDDPGVFIQTNITGTYQLLEASLQYWRSLKAGGGGSGQAEGFRFLHVSTDEVYGSLSLDEPAFTESSPYDPHSPYAASKAAADHLVRSWHETYALPVLLTNCSNNYGPGQFPEKLIPLVLSKCLRWEPIPIYGQGKNIRDWLYVGDHCEALYTVLTKGRVGETYNIGGNNEWRNIDLVRHLCGLMDELGPGAGLGPPASYESLIHFVADRPGHDLRYAMDTTKIREELGWEPTQDAGSGLRKTVEWYLEQWLNG
ncbi:MAG: dTDP-glucose 4,6-dehydratase [Puniceicoccaceae bacterium]|nr:MAG: dTDP-glucose 4,6-dehydratase [Puniceicoccaceae bacterium]